MRKKQNTFYMALLMPAIILFVVFFIVPVVQSMWLSFTDSYGMKTTYNFVGWKNYLEAFTDKTFTKTIGVTLKYALITVVIGNLLSLLLALLLDSRIRCKAVLRTFFFVPNMMSLLVVGYIWCFIYPDVFAALGMKSIALLGNKNTVIPALAAAGIWHCAGYYMVIYIAALQGISDDLIEAARIDGASTRQILRHIKLPLISPTIITCLILSVAAHMKVFELPYTMTSGGPVGSSATMVYKIYMTAFNANRNGYASAQAMILFIIIGGISLGLNLLMRKREERLG